MIIMAATKVVKQIDMLSFSVSMAIIHAILAFFVGIVAASIFSSLLGGAFGLAIIIIYPIMGFVGGFISGAIIAIIYNLMAGRYKIVRFNAEETAK
jgi:hypothetical protein